MYGTCVAYAQLRGCRRNSKLYGSGGATGAVPTGKSIRYIVRQLEKGRGIKVVAREMKVSQRHVQWLWVECLKTGTAHIRG